MLCGIITRFVAMTEMGSGRRDAPDVVLNDYVSKCRFEAEFYFSFAPCPVLATGADAGLRMAG